MSIHADTPYPGSKHPVLPILPRKNPATEAVQALTDIGRKPDLNESQINWLLREMDKVSALKEADNRKLLWLAMQTEPWRDCDPLSTTADILAELESRLYPEYDGENVRVTEWGWQTPDGEVRYLPDTPKD